jgi:transcriptional regulator with XRE-family HTH domain
MIKKRTLGSVVKQARDEARMTQRELAAAIGVKASHIAYIEAGRRRPSISPINRLGKTLGLDAKDLLVLAHPEAKEIIDSARPAGKKGNDAWQQFVSNQARC